MFSNQGKTMVSFKDYPPNPGVYFMKNKKGEYLYIGKAKNLKKRLASYFGKRELEPKTQVLVRQIHSIETIVTESEMEALILESNLIKEKRPRYNVQLKDNKSYPFIQITNEVFPRVIKTRKFRRDGSQYFGPYPNVGIMNQYLSLLKSLFPIRSCDLKLNTKRQFDPCLDYYIDRCKGCCIGKISQEEYQEYIQQAILFLRGRYNKLIHKLKQKMQTASQKLQYEQAAQYRNHIQAVQQIHEKQRVYSIQEEDLDVVGLFQAEGIMAISILFIREGKLLGKRSFLLKEERLLEFHPEKVLSEAVKYFYSGNEHEIPNEILLPLSFEDPNIARVLQDFLTVKRQTKVSIHAPQRGKKKAWIRMACENARFSYLEEVKMSDKEAVLSELKKELELSVEPRRIEAFDIANTLDQDMVASLVSFYNGKADKKNYRSFKIRSVHGPNDVESHQEALSRRYQKLKNEDKSFPDLILVDGGIPQVNLASKVLSALDLKIPIIGLAKKKEEIFFPKNPTPLVLAKNSRALRLLQEIRDEAHRFANQMHRRLRSNSMKKSLLDDVPKIGRSRKIALLRSFQSIEKIKQASIQELSEIPSMNLRSAESVYQFFHKTSQSS